MSEAANQENHPAVSRKNRLAGAEVALLTGGIALFLVLLYVMRDLLNPPLIALAALIMLGPLRKHTAVRSLLLSGAFLLVLWLLTKLSPVLFPFVLAYLLAYLFNPVVATLHTRFRVPRWASALVATILVVGLVVLILLQLIPSLVSQLAILAERILGSVSNLQTWLLESPALTQFEAVGLIDKQEFISRLTGFIQEQAGNLAGSIPNTVQTVIRSLSSLIGILSILAFIPVLLFYTLKDYLVLKENLINLFPTLGGRREYLVKAGSVVGNYVRGQLIISAIAATLVSVTLVLFGIPFALLIGLLAGLLNMIPNLGILITYSIGLLITLIFGDPWLLQSIIVFLVLLGESFLEQSVLTPNILGQQVGLHPVLILLSLFVFGYLMGLFGLLIAVPSTALLVTAYQAFRDELTLELIPLKANR